MKHPDCHDRIIVPYTSVFILTLILLLMFLIPILALSGYSVPAADDFSFSCETHAAVQNGGSLFDIIAAAVRKSADVYKTWQGTFSAIVLMAFQPSIWGFRYYGLTAYLMIFSLTGSLFLFCFRIFTGVFHVSRSVSGIIASVVSIACTQFLPSANQSFYWYNGAVYYTFTYSVMLVLLTVAVGFASSGGVWRLVILALLSVLVGGSNYVTALFTCIFFSCLILVLLWIRDPKWKGLLFPFAVLLTAFILSIIAPGNAVRQALFTERPGPVSAILLSFAAAAKNIAQWADLRFLACILFLLPFLWDCAMQVEDFSFPFPVTVTVLSFCFLSSMFTPQIYALGSDGPDRLKNILFFSFVLFSVFDLFWWCGWLTRKKATEKDTKRGIGLIRFLVFSFAGIVCIACSVVFFHGTLTSVAALGEMRSGEAQAYYAQALERQAVLEDSAVTDCEFRPFDCFPYLLHFADMTEDPLSYENVDTSTFYGKNSIIVQ